MCKVSFGSIVGRNIAQSENSLTMFETVIKVIDKIKIVQAFHCFFEL